MTYAPRRENPTSSVTSWAPEIDQAKNNRGVVGAGKTLKYPVPAGVKAGVKAEVKAGVKAVHPALAARRSREFNRADTDLLPAVTLEDDDEPETGS